MRSWEGCALTVWLIEQAIAGMRLDDSEGAHIAEDEIHEGVLRAIAEGRCEDPAACAQAALQTGKLNFDRWYS